jgi:hypothetical protein
MGVLVQADLSHFPRRLPNGGRLITPGMHAVLYRSDQAGAGIQEFPASEAARSCPAERVLV